MPALPAAAKLSAIYLNSFPFIGVAFGIGLAFAVLQLYFSRILNDASIASKAKESLNNVIDTAVILGVFTTAVWATSFAISSLAGVPYSETVHLELASISVEKLVALAETSYINTFITDAVYSVFFALHIPVTLQRDTKLATSSYIQPLVSIHALFDFISTIINLIIMNFLGVMARKYLITMAPYLVTFLLPFAILFRGMNFTKSLGSAVFALVAVLYYIYPLSVVFTDYLLFTQFSPSFISNNVFLTVPIEKLEVPGYSNIADFKRASEEYYRFATDPEIVDALKDINPSEDVQEYTSKNTLWTQVSSKIGDFMGEKGLIFGGGFALGVAGKTLEEIAQAKSLRGGFAAAAVGAKVAGILIALYTVNPVDTLVAFLDLTIKILFAAAHSTVLLLLALVLEILISITAYKQLAETFGGEALLFGLTKVV